MKRLGLSVLIAVLMVVYPSQQADAQALEIIKIIQAGVKKVIKAVDLKIQRLQNQTIWLQNAQKTIENTMSKLRLDEIADWVERQRTLYADYFDELYRVKSFITQYHRIKEIIDKQVRLVNTYKRAWGLLVNDKHFTVSEIEYMGRVYAGILEATLKNVEEISSVIKSYTVQISDGKRLEILNAVADKVDENYNDLRQFNTENYLLSLSRSKDEYEMALIKAMYGLE
jgi:ribosomal protein L31E